MSQIINIKKSNNKIIVLPNEDKLLHEKWTPDRDIMNFPSPVRVFLCSKPNSGKTNVILNMIAKADPVFDRIVVWHCSTATLEYDDVVLDKENDIVETCPSIDSWDPELKNLLIIDDVNLASLSKSERKTVDRTLGFVSTHLNVNVYVTSQNLTQCPVNLRKMMSVACIWRIMDTDSLALMARKVGVKRKYWLKLMDVIASDYHSFIVIDTTAGSPAPLRINMYDVVELPKDE